MNNTAGNIFKALTFAMIIASLARLFLFFDGDPNVTINGTTIQTQEQNVITDNVMENTTDMQYDTANDTTEQDPNRAKSILTTSFFVMFGLWFVYYTITDKINEQY